MVTRKPLSKSVWFEVFKRDKFTCQYCGEKAPNVVLQVDHIQPVAEGGQDELLNLVTACHGCNAGKGARLLSDDSVVERQRLQIEELEERRQQLEMILAWRDGLRKHGEDVVDSVCDYILAKSSWVPNEAGKQDIRRWPQRFSVDELLAAIDGSFDTYLEYSGDEPTDRSWGKAFAKIPAVATVNKQSVAKPYIRDLFYIQGIIRRRTGWKRYQCVEALEEVYLAGVPIESLARLAKQIDDVGEFEKELGDFWSENGAK